MMCVGGRAPRMMPWTGPERSLLPGEGEFLCIQNDHISFGSLRSLSKGMDLRRS